MVIINPYGFSLEHKPIRLGYGKKVVESDTNVFFGEQDKKDRHVKNEGFAFLLTSTLLCSWKNPTEILMN
jgi:hypothetical protein